MNNEYILNNLVKLCFISLSNFLKMLLVFLSSIIWVGIKISYLHTYPSIGWRCVKAKITNVSEYFNNVKAEVCAELF